MSEPHWECRVNSMWFLTESTGEPNGGYRWTSGRFYRRSVLNQAGNLETRQPASPDNTRQGTSENCAVLRLCSYSKRFQFFPGEPGCGEEGSMWDRYDPRDDDRDRGSAWDRDLGGRGSTSDRDRNENATRVTYSRRISTSHVEASAGRFGSATVSTRSMAPRAARWRRSARFGSSPRAIFTTSGTIPRTRGEASSTLRRKG